MKQDCWYTRPSRAVCPAPQQVPYFQCYQMCECVHMCLSATAIKTSPECNSHTTWQKGDRQNMNQSDLTRTIFQSILHHIFLWFYLISAYCLPFQMFLPFNCTLLLESGLCKAIKMLFLLSFSHRHPHALSLEPVQTLYLCLNLLKMIDDIDKTCLKATKAEFPQKFLRIFPQKFLSFNSTASCMTG